MSGFGGENIQIEESAITSNIQEIEDSTSTINLKKTSTGISRSDALDGLVEVYGNLSDVLDAYILKLNQDLTTINDAVSTMMETDEKLSDSVQMK